MKMKLLMLLALLGVFAAFSGSLQADAVIYEPFDYEVGGLDGQGDPDQVGFEGAWVAHADTLVAENTLTHGSLPTAGGSIGDLPDGNRFGGSRLISADALADKGLLDDGVALWFSVELGFGTGGNTANARLTLALANNQFNTGNYNYWINDDGEQLGSGIGVVLGRLNTVIGSVAAAQFRDAASGDALSGNILGNTSDALYAEGEHGLIVGKIVWGADSDTIEIYQADENLNIGSPISILTVSVDQSTFDTITWARGDKVVMDEIRFGENFAAVIGQRGPTNIYPADQSSVPTGNVELSWTNITAADPNSSTFVDVWFGSDPENMTQVVNADVDGENVESYLLENLAAGIYFWRVDTYINGSELINDDNKIESAVFTFNNDFAPEIDAGVDMVTWSGQEVIMAPGIVDDGASALTYLWTTDTDDPKLEVVISDPTAAVPTITITKLATFEPYVPNGSFEQVTAQSAITTSRDMWGHYDRPPGYGYALQYVPNSAFHFPDGTTPDGDIICRVVTKGDGLSRPDGLAMILDEKFDPSANYTLTVAVGHPFSPGETAYDETTWKGYTVQLVAGGEVESIGSGADNISGGTVIAEDANSIDIAPRTWETSTVIYTPNSASADLAGQPLQIRLLTLDHEDPAYPDPAKAFFDDVQLLVNGEPGSFVLDTEMDSVTLTLAVTDENNITPVVDTMTIDVYETACEATRDGGNQGVNNLTDINGDCVTNLKDFAAIAEKWLIDTSSTGPVDL